MFYFRKFLSNIERNESFFKIVFYVYQLYNIKISLGKKLLIFFEFTFWDTYFLITNHCRYVADDNYDSDNDNLTFLLHTIGSSWLLQDPYCVKTQFFDKPEN